jgi:hypothetical protein
MKLWRRSKALKGGSEALKKVEGSGGSTARSSGDGRKLWRRLKAPEAAL